MKQFCLKYRNEIYVAMIGIGALGIILGAFYLAKKIN